MDRRPELSPSDSRAAPKAILQSRYRQYRFRDHQPVPPERIELPETIVGPVRPVRLTYMILLDTTSADDEFSHSIFTAAIAIDKIILEADKWT